MDTFESAGRLSVSLKDVETTRMVLGEVPAAFHAGVHEILLIAFGLALAEFVGTGPTPIGIDVEATDVTRNCLRYRRVTHRRVVYH
ncbi:linear gramicidin synthetase subunit C domain protein [Mycobacterium xenopi 4042]|uniref:Linear gramicidin synthetase subunit C domain protein n=1 Tax=Mycobacterium xenopi 4042 TaxID=1299334 RepID=X8E5G9_MYCXE|nr:linear gramicidin synthetase subunit C domain protein [Mycobacterium xenopi 4042]